MIQFKINFGGFYCSVFSDIIDEQVEQEITEGYIKNDDNINYSDLYNKVAETIHDNIEQSFFYGVSINYIRLKSPKYYNYSTDVIISEISKEDFETLSNEYLKQYDFIKYVNDTSKSFDGFISFYSGIEAVKKKPAILLEYIFNYIRDNEDNYYCYVCDNLHETILNNL